MILSAWKQVNVFFFNKRKKRVDTPELQGYKDRVFAVTKITDSFIKELIFEKRLVKQSGLLGV